MKAKRLGVLLLSLAMGLTIGLVGCKAANSLMAPGVATVDPALAERLQEALDKGLESANGKGVSAAVIMPEGEMWVGVSGVSHGTTPITTGMPFAAGSIGKQFTAAAVLQLVEEGEISLDDPLSDWLPAYPHVDGTITIRQLLNHTGGLYDIVDNPVFWDAVFDEPSKAWTPEEMVRAFNREAIFAKGTDWNYSTTGYALLRTMIEEATGQAVPTVYRERFFVPLSLEDTFVSMGEPLPAGTAHGWWDLDGDDAYDDFFSWPRTAFASAIGGEVFSTAADMAKWARALFHERSVLSEASLDQMLTFHSPCTGEEFFSAGYGLGVMKFNPQLFNGLEAYGHSGNAPGYAALSAYLPDYGVSLGFMVNTEKGEAMMTVADLLEILTSHLDEGP